MQTRQTKTHSPSTTSTAAESSTKAAVSAASATRVPAWANAWGDRPPTGLFMQESGQAVSIQTKLTVNQPGDAYEQEADRVANQIMRMPEASLSVQRKCACGGSHGAGEEECEECAKKRLEVQRRSANKIEPSAVPHSVSEVVSSSGGQPLNATTRAFMEPRFGQDFSQVRIHSDTHATESAEAVNALAYTVGQDVVFGAGQYAPGTGEGQRLLAHELAHVVQQQEVSGGLIQRRMKVINPTGTLPGSPPRQNWEDIRDYLANLCTAFTVNSSGDVTPSSAAVCPATSGSTACQCLCTLHNSRTTPLWNIQIDDTTWPHTSPSSHTATVHSSRSIFSFGAWGGGASAGRRISEDNTRVLSHEMCGHAWLEERGSPPPFVVSSPLAPAGASGGRPDHDPTVQVENRIASERGGRGSEERGQFAASHHGESFARVTISGFGNGLSDIARLTPDMQSKLATAKDFILRSTPGLPDILVDVIGHDDHSGLAVGQARVSTDRANSVRSWLQGNGVPSARFRSVRGVGDAECPASSSGVDPACCKVDIFMFIEEAGSRASP